jgi:hypothetical protein
MGCACVQRLLRVSRWLHRSQDKVVLAQVIESKAKNDQNIQSWSTGWKVNGYRAVQGRINVMHTEVQ